MTAHGAAVSLDNVPASPFMMMALALVVASFPAYLGFARNVRSPGPASSIFATRRISIAASPSMGHSRRRANSPSVTKARLSRGRRHHPFEEQGHFRQTQALGHLVNHLVPRHLVER